MTNFKPVYYFESCVSL